MRLRRPQRFSWVGITLRALQVAVLAFVVIGTFLTLQVGLFSFASWRDLFIFGIAQGSIYALIALGYTLVYGILFMINFAHGEVFMTGAFTAWFVAVALADSGLLAGNPIIGVGIILLVSMLTSMTVAVLLERIAYRPLRGAPRLVPLITAIGASLVLQYSVRGMYGAGVRAYPWGSIPLLNGRVDILGVQVSAIDLDFALATIASAFVHVLLSPKREYAADRLWRLLAEEDFVNCLGAVTGRLGAGSARAS